MYIIYYKSNEYLLSLLYNRVYSYNYNVMLLHIIFTILLLLFILNDNNYYTLLIQ